ncbi:U3 snoRNP protein [Orbilia javanica]|uniref:U3 snoRNP protein n=1 Tax=Orbilia javanica TaxID=47235 RepID=A0AAN8RFU6_9PEZI
MANQLLTSLLYQPSNNLGPNSDIYHESVFNTQFYLNALAGAESAGHNVHTVGFDIEQIWMQSQALLGAIQESAYSCEFRGEPENEPPRKRTRRNNRTQTKEPIGPGFDEHTSISQEPLEDVRDSSSDTSSSEAEPEFGAPSNNDHTLNYPSDTSRGRVRSELDDGFFSIEAFNLDTEAFEHADELGKSLGELDTTINWSVDPDDDVDGSAIDSDTSEGGDRPLMYTDFFLPPEYPGNRSGLNGSGTSAKWPPEEINAALNGSDEMMNEIERDLFDKMSSGGQSWASEASEGMGHSSHRSVQARLSDHIRELEKQNIDKREWVLSGETNSKQRPFNSLLQEDLDFERIGKPVPVVTQESTTTLEEMIKGRIITGLFDEILRRNLEQHQKSRRPVIELEDSKSKVGLAEVYEQDHLEKAIPSQPQAADVKLDALRSEISSLFSAVSGQLDMLSSWHFTPKTPQSTLSVVQDVRTLDMEEVQVNANHLSGPTSTALAPQEVYNPSTKEHQSDGVIKVSGIPMSLSEVERSKRTKERNRKNQKRAGPTGMRTSTDDNVGILRTLQKADVAVIGRDGKQVSLGGSRPEKTSSGSRIKL